MELWTKKLNALSLVALLTATGCSVKPLTSKEQYSHALYPLQQILHNQDKPQTPISLEEAVARTIKYNLDHRVAQAQTALEYGNFKLALIEMLPNFPLDMNHSFRNNELIQNLVQNGQISPGETSTMPKVINTTSIGLEWNALDIGLSYTRAQQQSQKTLVADEQRRRLTQQLVQEATTAYWRAYVAQTMRPKVQRYKQQAKQSLARSKEALRQKSRASEIELDYQKVLIKSIRRANELERMIANAKYELARLMNIAPGATFTLAAPDSVLTKLPSVRPNLVKLDTIALIYRPELREASYQTLIRKKGIQASILNLLPGINFDFGYNYTDNKFLLNKTWYGGNLNLAWNLLQPLLKGPQEIQLAKDLHLFEKLKEAAMSISVLTQVRMALLEYYLMREDYHYAHQEAVVSNRLLNNAIALASANKGNEQVTMRRGIEKLNAEFDEKISLSKTQTALFKIYQSVGIDILPDDARYLPLDKLTHLVKKVFTQQARGQFDKDIDQRFAQLLPELKLTEEEKKAYRSHQKALEPITQPKPKVIFETIKTYSQAMKNKFKDAVKSSLTAPTQLAKVSSAPKGLATVNSKADHGSSQHTASTSGNTKGSSTTSRTAVSASSQVAKKRSVLTTASGTTLTPSLANGTTKPRKVSSKG